MKKTRLFYAIAQLAIDAGREIILSADDTRSTSKALNGAIMDSLTDSRRLSLTIYPPEPDSRREEAEEAQ